MDNNDELPLPPNPAANAGAAAHARLPSLNLPEFWADCPTSWFAMAEAQFHLLDITANRDKHCFVLRALPRDAYRLVSHIINQQPGDDSYARLKAALLAGHEMSDFQRVDRMSKLETLGGRKPSQLLALMLELCPSGHENSPFFTWFFLQRLPRELRIALGNDDFGDLRAVAAKADNLWDAGTLRQHEVVAAVESPPDEELVAAAAAGPARGKGPGRGRFGKPAPKKKPSAGDPSSHNLPFCWYHIKFGDKAARCHGGECAWPSEN